MPNILSTIETDFSKVTSAIAAAFKSTPVATDLASTLTAAEQAIPQLADAGLSAAMATLGAEAEAFSPLAISFLNSLISKAEAKIATLAPAAA
jgi:hypothetical protein